VNLYKSGLVDNQGKIVIKKAQIRKPAQPEDPRLEKPRFVTLPDILQKQARHQTQNTLPTQSDADSTRYHTKEDISTQYQGSVSYRSYHQQKENQTVYRIGDKTPDSLQKSNQQYTLPTQSDNISETRNETKEDIPTPRKTQVKLSYQLINPQHQNHKKGSKTPEITRKSSQPTLHTQADPYPYSDPKKIYLKETTPKRNGSLSYRSKQKYSEEQNLLAKAENRKLSPLQSTTSRTEKQTPSPRQTTYSKTETDTPYPQQSVVSKAEKQTSRPIQITLVKAEKQIPNPQQGNNTKVEKQPLNPLSKDELLKIIEQHRNRVTDSIKKLTTVNEKNTESEANESENKQEAAELYENYND
jgi:hypothetical protein